MDANIRYQFARVGKGLSIIEAAQKSNLLVIRIAQIESGMGDAPTRMESLKLAIAYGWSVDAIMGKHKDQSLIDEAIKNRLLQRARKEII